MCRTYSLEHLICTEWGLTPIKQYRYQDKSFSDALRNTILARCISVTLWPSVVSRQAEKCPSLSHSPGWYVAPLCTELHQSSWADISKWHGRLLTLCRWRASLAAVVVCCLWVFWVITNTFCSADVYTVVWVCTHIVSWEWKRDRSLASCGGLLFLGAYKLVPNITICHGGFYFMAIRLMEMYYFRTVSKPKPKTNIYNRLIELKSQDFFCAIDFWGC